MVYKGRTGCFLVAFIHKCASPAAGENTENHRKYSVDAVIGPPGIIYALFIAYYNDAFTIKSIGIAFLTLLCNQNRHSFLPATQAGAGLADQPTKNRTDETVPIVAG